MIETYFIKMIQFVKAKFDYLTIMSIDFTFMAFQ